MIELFDRGDGTLSLAFGGDTLNTAVYLARLGVDVAYITALGDDPYSDAMLGFWRKEGIDTALVARLPDHLPGLYTIRTDASGERSFYYWRSAAAARALINASDSDALELTLGACDLIYLSGVTLSILDEDSLCTLFALIDGARAAGAAVAFDSNYRPRGWPNIDAARAAMVALLGRVDIALPTFDDETALHDDHDAEACVTRLHALGVREVVVKRGGEPCLVGIGQQRWIVPAEPMAQPVDTTAAGDAFNAAYLAARLNGATPDAAARAGHRLAATVIAHRGAVIPLNAMPTRI